MLNDLMSSPALPVVAAVVLTLLAYLAGLTVYQRSGRAAWASPVLVGMAIVCAALLVFRIDYARYFKDAYPVHFLLGPATVALAVPLARQARLLREMLWPLSVGLFAGCLSSLLSTLLILACFGVSPVVYMTLAAKSVTTPIAMAVSAQLGGNPFVTAALVIVTGVLGAMIGSLVCRLAGIRLKIAQGLAMGVSAHGIGTARAFQISTQTGLIAGLGMGLNGIATSLLAPWLVPAFLKLLHAWW